MRKLQEPVDQAQFVHDLQRRGMHGITTKITEEVGVLFQNHRLDAGAAEQVAQHHAGRTAADDAAAGFYRARWLSLSGCALVHDLAFVGGSRSTAKRSPPRSPGKRIEEP